MAPSPGETASRVLLLLSAKLPEVVTVLLFANISMICLTWLASTSLPVVLFILSMI